jgi:hypothetical protein
MAKTNITVRVDEEIKAKAELACEYFGTTLTHIINHQLRRTIDEYYKHRANEADQHKRITQGVIAQSAHDVLKAIVELRQSKGATLVLRPEVEKLLFDWGEE